MSLLALSCVVLGKQVEFAVLSALSRSVPKMGFTGLCSILSRAPRNLPMQKFLEAIAVAEAGIGYAVDVASLARRLQDAAVSPGTWNRYSTNFR